MSKILLIVATVLVLASAGLTFLTMGQKAGLKTERDSLTAELGTTRSNLAKSQEAEKAAAESLVAETAKREATESELVTATQALDKAKTDLTNASQELEQAKAEVTELNNRIASMPTGTSTTGDPTSEVPGGVAEITAQLKEAQTQLDEAQQLNDSLTGRVSEMQGQMAVLKEKAEQRDRQIMAKGLEGQILAVNPAWNFVVVSIGDRQGVVPNAEMVVFRDGQQVGKVKITSVEPTTSIADVVPGSTSRGDSVRPGDRVIYPGA